MTIPDRDIIPYLASTLWFQGKIDTGVLKPRILTRTLIESNSPEGMVLTVPIAGGSAAVKRLPPAEMEVSGHGDWTRIHLGAIEAAYGREPYFQHLFPHVAEIITGYPSHLLELNRRLARIMLEFAGYDASIGDIEVLRKRNPDRYSMIASRLLSKIDPAHSLLEPLFRFGPDTIFLLHG